jgi:DNA polymerase-3 subunit alpha
MEALQELRAALAEGERGRGEVIVRLMLGEPQEPVLRLGRDFVLDGELVERLAEVEGLSDIVLKPQTGRASLRLVA